MITIECDLKMKCKHLPKNGFYSFIFERKDEKCEIQPYAFDYRQLRPTLKYWKNCVFESYEESFPGLANINHLS